MEGKVGCGCCGLPAHSMGFHSPQPSPITRSPRAIVFDPLEPPHPSLPGKLEGRLPSSDERVEWYHDPGTGQFAVGFAVGIGHFIIARQMSLQCLLSRFREVDPFRQARLQAANMCFGGADPFFAPRPSVLGELKTRLLVRRHDPGGDQLAVGWQRTVIDLYRVFLGAGTGARPGRIPRV